MGALVLNARLYGAVFSVVVIPVRVGKNCLQARYFSHRSVQGRLRVAIALTPTLIFTLVIAGILHEEDTVHPDDLETMKKKWAMSVRSGDPLQMEYRLRAADGSWHCGFEGDPQLGAMTVVKSLDGTA